MNSKDKAILGEKNRRTEYSNIPADFKEVDKYQVMLSQDTFQQRTFAIGARGK